MSTAAVGHHKLTTAGHDDRCGNRVPDIIPPLAASSRRDTDTTGVITHV